MSLRIKSVVFSIGLLLLASGLVASIAYIAMERQAESQAEDETARALGLASTALEEIGARMAGHAALLAANPDVSGAISKGEKAELERIFVKMFNDLRAVDPSVSVLEASDKSGKILIRGHNPARAGDDKSREPGFAAALRGASHTALTISPTSREAAYIAVRALRAANGDIIGALNVGARLRMEMAAEVKKSSGLDVVLMVNGVPNGASFDNRDTNALAALKDVTEKAASGKSSEAVTLFGADYLLRAMRITSDNGHQLAVSVLKDRSSHYANLRAFATQLGMQLAIMLAVLVPAILYGINRVMRRVATLTTATTRIAGGELDLAVPGAEATDELGELARAVLVFRQAAQSARRLEAEAAETQHRHAEERMQLMQQAADDLERMVGAVSGALAENASGLLRAASGLDRLATQAEVESASATGFVQQAAEDARNVSAASNELAASIAEIGNQISQANSVSGTAVAETGRVTEMIDVLNKATSRIGEVVTLISTIAEQTNLLALNATIEAARAGEAGKGFAVVAQEVKQLASQTAKAIGDIGSQINEVQHAARQVAGGMESVSSTIGQVSLIASTIAAAVQQQDAATSEIARSISKSADRTREAEEAGLSLAHLVKQVMAQASDLDAVSKGVSQRSEELQQRVADVVRAMRAA